MGKLGGGPPAPLLCGFLPFFMRTRKKCLTAGERLWYLIGLLNGESSSVGRAPDCGSGCRGIVPRLSPQFPQPLPQGLFLCPYIKVYGPGRFFREDGLAWKPGGLHCSFQSRRPWDFHAIASLKGRSKGNWKFGLLAGLRPTLCFSPLRRRETEGGGRGQRRSRRATDGARGGSRQQLRLCGSFIDSQPIA